MASLIFIYQSIIDTHHGCGAELIPAWQGGDSKEEKVTLVA
jgi:hypothetical protein